MPCFISKTTHKINEWVSRLMSGCPCSKWFLLWCGLNKSRLSTVIGEPSKYWKVSRNWLKIGRGNMEGQICGIVRSYGSREIYVFFWKTILSECYTQHGLSKRVFFPVGKMDELFLATVYPFHIQKGMNA